MENVAEIMDDSITSVLPPEVLSNILSFLPLRDRKKARLVSRSWYNCSILSSITERERFVFSNSDQVKNIVKVVRQSYYPQLNMVFRCLLLCTISKKMWKTCGERIRTLEFYNCEWDDTTLRNIIYYCKNLTSFVLETMFLEPKRSEDKIPWSSPSVLTDLVEKDEIRRPKLRTFSIFVNKVPVPMYAIREIFLLFPCIENFSFGMAKEGMAPSFKGTSLYLPRSLISGILLDKSEFDKKDLIAFTKLESFTFNLLTRGEWMETFIEEDKQGHGLRRFETILYYESNVKKTLFKFFKLQENLQVIKLQVEHVYSDEIEEIIKHILFRILECCPKLRELHLKSGDGNMHFEPFELPRFFASIKKLKTLSLSFDVLGGSKSAPSYHDSLSNTVPSELTSLTWEPRRAVKNFVFIAAFLEHFSSLQHLNLAVCCDTSLQVIFKNMVELRTLVLNNMAVCTSFGFTGYDVSGKKSGYSIKRLRKLKHLEMRYHKSDFPAKIASELQLPDLEFLSYDGMFSRTSTSFGPDGACEIDIIMQGCPNLTSISDNICILRIYAAVLIWCCSSRMESL